ncbi:MAG TPA: PEP-CTERM sorting domain-containing protein [Chthoniobacterales bacterium]|nr:PEP-CTERM sorting domain-containing protein [Chthoniobacterales bacterium]
MSRLIRSLLLPIVAVLSIASLSAQEVYLASGSGGTPGTLYRYNASTGQQLSAVPITNVSGNGAIGVTGLAFNPLNGLLYGVSVHSVAAGNTVASSLLTINPTTGKATVLGALTLGAASAPVSDIAFASDGTLYGWEARSPFSLATIGLSGAQTGKLTTIGNAGIGFTTGGGLALSPTDPNTFYVSATGADPDFGGRLSLINRQTGAGTAGPSLTGAPKLGSINAMAFFGNTLYGVNSSQDPEELGDDNLPDEIHIVTINLVNGAVHDLFRVKVFNLDAIAFAQIPEPSTVALLATGAVGAVALRFRRRRK